VAPGDIILKVNEAEIASVEALRRASSASGPLGSSRSSAATG